MIGLHRFLAVAVSLALGLLVFELGLRLLGKGPPAVLNRFDPALGWSKQRGQRVHRKTAEYDVTFELNTLGLRDDADLTVAKPPGVFRVLCLGDSFTLGYAVDREDLFVDQLEQWWNAEGRNVQVVNLGTEGYAIDQEVAWLEEHGAAWAPDLVLVVGYDNDLYYHSQDRYLAFPKPRYTPSGQRERARLADPGLGGLRTSTALGRLLFPGQALDRIAHPANGHLLAEFGPLMNEPPAFMEDVEARTRGIFTALAREAHTLGAEVVFMPIPSHSAVDEDYARLFSENKSLLGAPRNTWNPNRASDLLLESAQGAGVPTLDPRAHLRAAAAAGAALYFRSDFHLNPAGNRALTEFLHAALDARVPPATEVRDLTSALPSESASARRRVPRFALVFVGLWAVLGALFAAYYQREEKPLLGFLKVGALLATVFGIAIGGGKLLGLLPPRIAQLALPLVLLALLTFVLVKLGDRIGTIAELIKAFVVRGHWYLLPLVVVLLTVGSLLVVAASSPLVAPFIYTLF